MIFGAWWGREDVWTLARYDIASKLLTVDQGPMVYNLDQVLVTRDHGSVHVPLGDHGSGRGAAGECQLGVNGQFLGQTGPFSVHICLKSA